MHACTHHARARRRGDEGSERRRRSDRGESEGSSWWWEKLKGGNLTPAHISSLLSPVSCFMSPVSVSCLLSLLSPLSSIPLASVPDPASVKIVLQITRGHRAHQSTEHDARAHISKQLLQAPSTEHRTEPAQDSATAGRQGGAYRHQSLGSSPPAEGASSPFSLTSGGRRAPENHAAPPRPSALPARRPPGRAAAVPAAPPDPSAR